MVADPIGAFLSWFFFVLLDNQKLPSLPAFPGFSSLHNFLSRCAFPGCII